MVVFMVAEETTLGLRPSTPCLGFRLYVRVGLPDHTAECVTAHSAANLRGFKAPERIRPAIIIPRGLPFDKEKSIRGQG
jgi:hypothetical protein